MRDVMSDTADGAATIRSRKRFARRQWARRWLAWRRVVALLLLIALMVGAVWLFYFSDVLAVKDVEVHGDPDPRERGGPRRRRGAVRPAAGPGRPRRDPGPGRGAGGGARRRGDPHLAGPGAHRRGGTRRHRRGRDRRPDPRDGRRRSGVPRLPEAAAWHAPGAHLDRHPQRRAARGRAGGRGPAGRDRAAGSTMSRWPPSTRSPSCCATGRPSCGGARRSRTRRPRSWPGCSSSRPAPTTSACRASRPPPADPIPGLSSVATACRARSWCGGCLLSFPTRG